MGKPSRFRVLGSLLAAFAVAASPAHVHGSAAAPAALPLQPTQEEGPLSVNKPSTRATLRPFHPPQFSSLSRARSALHTRHASAGPAAAGNPKKPEVEAEPLAAPALIQDGGFGWQNSENLLKRNYVCKYSEGGGPCSSRAYGSFPSGLKCPPSYCCSKTHIVHGQSGQWCTNSWALCNGVLNIAEYSYGKCNCANYTHLCPDSASCRQEDSPLGGAYCECKEGYLGDGTTCVEDLCRTQPCHPGKCTLANGQVQCTCPENYEVDKTTMPQSCKVADMCKDSPCGDVKAAKACYHEGPGRYSCTCNAGYVAVEVNNKLKCDDVFNHFVCSTYPCGVDGVKECLDTDRGVRCTCMSGYNLVKETTQYRCVREDPCLQNPCGNANVVNSCVATSTSYVCDCKEGYQVAMEGGGQYCALLEQETNYVLYAGIGGGALILLLGVYACTYMKKGPELDEEEVQFLEENANGVSSSAYFNPQGGWS